MNVSVDLDLDIKITGVSQAVAEYAKDRFDNFYDANGLLFLDMEEEDGDFNILTNWSAGYSLPTPNTLKEQFERWIGEKAKASVGDTIQILDFARDNDGELPQSEQKLIGKTGVVTDIGGMGELHGTWGGLAVLTNDKYKVIAFAK